MANHVCLCNVNLSPMRRLSSSFCIDSGILFSFDDILPSLSSGTLIAGYFIINRNGDDLLNMLSSFNKISSQKALILY